jgi:hypothetical protein
MIILTPPKSPNEYKKFFPGHAINICALRISNCLEIESTVAGVNSPWIKNWFWRISTVLFLRSKL